MRSTILKTKLLERLVSLSLVNCSGLTEKLLIVIVKRALLVERLDLTGCSQLTNLVLEEIGGAGRRLGKRRPLKSLNLTNCKLVGDSGISALVSCGNVRLLESLNLRSCVGITNASLYAIANAAKARQGILDKIGSLTLSGCGNVTDAGVIALVRACRNILKLDLSGCHRISPEALSTMAQIVPLSRAPISRGRIGLEPRGAAVRAALARLLHESRAARRLQRRYRLRLLGKAKFRARERERLAKLTMESESCKRIQAWWRGILARVLGDAKGMAAKMHRRRFVRSMATKISATIRMHLAVQYVKRLRREARATDIQRVCYRGPKGRAKALRHRNNKKASQFLRKMKNRIAYMCFDTWRVKVHQKVQMRDLATRCFGTVKHIRWADWRLYLALRLTLKKRNSFRIYLWYRERVKERRYRAACLLQSRWRIRQAREDLKQRRREREEQEGKVALQLRRLRMRVVIKCLLALQRYAIMCRRVKALAARCLMSTTRVYYDKLHGHAIWCRRRKIAGAILVQKRYRGWKGRVRALGFRNIRGADRLRRNEVLVRDCLDLRRREMHARWVIKLWWKRSLLRWRTPIYLNWQRNASATELQRIVRGYLHRAYAYEKWRVWTEAAVNVQRLYRGHLGRKAAMRQRTSIHLQRAAIMLQRAYRAKRNRDQRDEMMRAEIEATITIQRVYRGHRGRESSRNQAWELHLKHMSSFSSAVQRNLGFASYQGTRNKDAMREVRRLKLLAKENRRKVRNRKAKRKVLEEDNRKAKAKCHDIVQELLDHRTRISCVTEAIFQDSNKRSELVNLHQYMKSHMKKLQVGLDRVHAALKEQAYLKMLLNADEFDEIVAQNLGVDGDAASQVMRYVSTSSVKVAPSPWAKNRAKAMKRDKPLPLDKRPLDADGKPIPCPPVVPFMWPKITGYAE